MNISKEKLEEFLSGLLSSEEIEEQRQQIEASREQQIADARIFFEVFGEGRGVELLEILKHKTVYASTMERSGAICDADIPLNPGEFMAMREGQNALIRFIERQIKLSQEKI